MTLPRDGPNISYRPEEIEEIRMRRMAIVVAVSVGCLAGMSADSLTPLLLQKPTSAERRSCSSTPATCGPCRAREETRSG